MLDQLNVKLTVFNIRAWAIDSYRRKMIETKQTFAGEMVSVKVDWCAQGKRHFME